jgi:3-deoxy-D-manno-octulosonic-acid transferase
MPNNTITDTHTKGETPYATVKLFPSDITPRDRQFLKHWAEKLGVTIEVLLKRMLIAACERQQYAEKMPEI